MTRSRKYSARWMSGPLFDTRPRRAWTIRIARRWNSTVDSRADCPRCGQDCQGAPYTLRVHDVALGRAIALAAFLWTYLGLMLGRIPGFRVDRTGIAIIGA